MTVYFVRTSAELRAALKAAHAGDTIEVHGGDWEPAMARKHLAPCNTPGCPELTKDSYCETHHAERRRASDARRPGRHARGYDRPWQRTRRSYLTRHFFCEHPGCTSQATEVHHKDGLGPTGPRGHDQENLEALCKPHHAKRTAQDQPGGWAA